MPEKTPDDREEQSWRRVWAYWVLFAVAAAFVLWAIGYLGSKNLSAVEPSGSDVMTIVAGPLSPASPIDWARVFLRWPSGLCDTNLPQGIRNADAAVQPMASRAIEV